jgi:hypothetical protein
MTTAVQRVSLGDGTHTVDWLVSTRAGQSLLASVHNTTQRPLCQCVPGGVAMYVGRRGQSYYLSRMPGSGFLHSENCESVVDSPLLSGAQCYAPEAIVEHPDGSLSIRAKLDHGIRPLAPLAEVGIDGLLDLLVEQAELNRLWADEEPRRWSSVHERLKDATNLIRLGETPLSDCLHLPAPFRSVPKRLDKAVIENPARYALLVSTFQDFVNSHASGALICAPLKMTRSMEFSWQLVLKQLPTLRLWLSKSLTRELESRWATPMVSEPPRYSLCMARLKRGRGSDNYTVTNLAIMPTDANFFPCGSEREAAVVKALHQEGCDLVRPLRFETDPATVLADFAILNGETPEPVFVLAPTGNETADAAKRSLAGLMQRNHACVRVFENISQE